MRRLAGVGYVLYFITCTLRQICILVADKYPDLISIASYIHHNNLTIASFGVWIVSTDPCVAAWQNRGGGTQAYSHYFHIRTDLQLSKKETPA